MKALKESVSQRLQELLRQAEGFSMGRYRMVLQLKGKGRLAAYKGATFRGGFGYAFKRAVCVVRHRECFRCLLLSKCPYPYVFETPRPQQAELMRRYEKVPHPFVLEPPLQTETEFVEESALTFHLVLFGKAIELLPFFILAIERLGNTGLGKDRIPFEIVEVSTAEPIKARTILYRGGEESLSCLPPSYKLEAKAIPEPDHSHPLSLLPVTPLRLMVNGKISRTVPFDKLISSLLRRFSMISYFHTDRKIAGDYRGIVECARQVSTLSASLQWHDFERYSTRQERRMNLGGVFGEVVFDERAFCFFPLLWLGQWLHAGKGTSFGLGQYRIRDGT